MNTSYAKVQFMHPDDIVYAHLVHITKYIGFGGANQCNVRIKTAVTSAQFLTLVTAKSSFVMSIRS